MNSEPDGPQRIAPLSSRGYHLTVGDDSFFALSIEEEHSETAWLMSDTVRSLEEMR